jgi:hypothetical protein
VSYYNSLPPEHFPCVTPSGVGVRCLPELRPVRLSGETLKMYDRKRKLGLATPKLAQYCTLSTFYTHAMRPPFVKRLTDNPASWASKIGAVVDDLEEAVQVRSPEA